MALINTNLNYFNIGNINLNNNGQCKLNLNLYKDQDTRNKSDNFDNIQSIGIGVELDQATIDTLKTAIYTKLKLNEDFPVDESFSSMSDV